MRIIFSIKGKSTKHKWFDANGLNPGTGGTQFSTIILAMNLAKEREDYEIWLWSEVKLKLKDQPKNLKQILAKEAPFPNSDLFNSTSTIFICSDGTIQRPINKSKKVKCKIVNWIHHPFVLPSFSKNIKYSAHVSIGTYQYYSHGSWYKPHWNIPYLFNLQSFNLRKYKTYSDGQTLRLVFLGALVLGKGFHFLAKEWPKIKKNFSNVQLDVIGSTQTYTGDKPENKKIPTTEDYAKKILKFISDEDIESKRVIFHGNLGEEKFKIINNAHLAIINPTGRTETFSYSSLECLMSGTPIITSYDYGMSDFMRNFPEATISKTSDITSKIISIINDKILYQNLQNRSIKVAKSFSERKPKILIRWQKLIDALNSNKIIKNNPPEQSFKGNKSLLTLRILIRLILIFIKFVFRI